MSGARAAAQAAELEEAGAGGDDLDDIERRARDAGWKPLDEYKGNPAQWRDAATFLKRGEEELPILRERLRKQERDLADLKRTGSASLQAQQEMADRLRRADERAYAKAKADLEAQKREAVQNGDTAAFDAVEASIKALDEDAKPAARQQQQQPAAQAAAVGVPPPEVQAWGRRNPWFQALPELKSVAESIHIRLLTEEPDLSLAENLERMTAEMREMYPDRVRSLGDAQRPAARQQAAAGGEGEEDDNPRRRQAPAVAASGGDTGPRRAGAHTFEAMPKDSREAFTRYAKQFEAKEGFKPLTKAEWAADYWAQFEE